MAKIEALFERSQRIKEKLDQIPLLLERLRKSILASAFRGDLTADWRQQNPDVEPASQLLERIRQERRQCWETEELAKMKAKGKTPKNDQWKTKYKEPEPVNNEDLPELPEGWCWIRLSEIGELSRGKSKHRPRNDPKLFGKLKPFIQTGDVARSNGMLVNYTQMYSEFGVRQSRIFPVGTICITIAANIADSCVLGVEACFPDSIVGLIVNQDFIPPQFVEFYIRTIRENLARFAPATAQANINLGILNEVFLPIPPQKELIKIAEIAQSALNKTDLIQNILISLKSRNSKLNQSILAKAFRGELVPQDPKDEPASVLLERIQKEKEAKQPKKTPKRQKKPIYQQGELFP